MTSGALNNTADEIALRFVAARREQRALTEFPGKLPESLEAAYKVQDAAIKLWSDQIGGWKVGLIGGQFKIQHGNNRLVGPIFKSLIRTSASNVMNSIPVFVDGFGAIEAEFVFKIGKDAPADKFEWTNEEAASVVESLHAGVEIASSPLPTINDLGPTSVISDFGNNNGLIVGAPISNWQQRLGPSLTCSTEIDGKQVGTGTAASIPEGPLASLVFALCVGASRGFPLRAGQYVCTGAATGVHVIHQHQLALIKFDGIDEFKCEAVAVGTK